MLGRCVVRPIDPATKHIILKIVGFLIIIKSDKGFSVQWKASKITGLFRKRKDEVRHVECK